MSKLQIVGRRSSLFTRMPLIFAEELSVTYELLPIYDMTALELDIYAGNPALKLPILRENERLLFGAQNICRAIWERSGAEKRIAWPESLNDDLSRNAQELVWHCMAMQVQLIMGTMVNSLPGESPFFVKARSSFTGSLQWLDKNLAAAVRVLPARDLSLFEVSLFSLADHIVFRGPLALDSYPALVRFRNEFAQRPAAQRTAYRFDVKQAADHGSAAS
jgi:glutathione S-transferase